MTVAHAALLRILLVEDDAVIAALMAELLEDLGYEVCPVETTEAGAVSAAARRRPDLMIVDLHLAEGSGLSTMARIGQAGLVPHIFMSGDVELTTPGVVLLRKPFRPADLVRAIGQALGVVNPQCVA